MIVKINEYYKVQIDQAKGIVVKEDYTLKAPYFFLSLYSLAIFYNITLLSADVHLMIIILYTLPMIIGTIYEFFKLKQYKKSVMGQDTIKRILELGLIRIINILFFLLTAILICTLLISTELFGIFNFVNQMNNLLMIVYFINIIVIGCLFRLGFLLEKRQVIKKNKNEFVTILIIGILTLILYFIIKESDFTMFIIFTSIGYVSLSYVIGRGYFRYQYFDKKVSENDKLIDYEL